MIGAAMTLGGAWLRQLVSITGRFDVAIIGTSVAALGQVFFINSSSKLATTWFGDKERGLATALGGLALPIGCIVGFVIPAIMISDDLAKDHELGKTKFAEYLIV